MVPRYRMTRPKRRRRPAAGLHVLALQALLGVLAVLGVSRASGQNLINSGQINNSGTLRVKNQAIGLPSTVDGVFEFFGADQQVPARQYNNLTLTGTGTKTTIGGSFGVIGTVTIAAPVVLDVQSGETITLGGALNEQGYLHGSINKTVNLSGPTTTSDFGHIGLEIAWSGAAPGATTVTRRSGVASQGNGHQSILRSYDVAPTFGTGLTSTIAFRYDARELNGHDSASLDLWRSIDGGTTWRRQRTTRDAANKTLVRSSLPFAGAWTAADSNNLLGRPNFEWDPDSVSTVTPDSVKGTIRKTLAPFIARVTDVFGNPVADAPVTFAIVSKPAGSAGELLTPPSGISDSLGNVQTQLTLGSVRGLYIVQATVAGGPGAVVLFKAQAEAKAVALPIAAGNNQTDSIKTLLPTPLSVVAHDSSGTAVEGVPVVFTIVSAPPGATGQQFTNLVDTTDAAGTARASFRFGTKAGRYVIKAYSPEIANDTATFSLTATHGLPALVWQDSIVRRDTIGTILPPLTYTVTDGDTNAVPGRTVQFAIVERPMGSTDDTLLNIQPVTDSLGHSSAALRLGTRAGTYLVSAMDLSLPNSARVFAAEATPGSPAQALATVPATADSIGATLPPFWLRVADRGDNPVRDVMVNFAQISRPAGASGDTLVPVNPLTDSLGRALAQFRLGDKIGPYTVQLTSPALLGYGSTATFEARPGMPSRMLTASGGIQTKSILQQLDSLFIVQLADRALNPISADTIQFLIAGTPAGASGHSLSVQTAVTDSSGQASTRLMLGSKVGMYTVSAHSARRPDVRAEFFARATNGAAARMATPIAATLSRPILTMLDTAFTVQLTDIGGNGVPRASVQFAVATKPIGSVHDSLVPTLSLTDSSGQAATVLRLGSRVGDYVVTAVTAALPGDTLRFRAHATVGAPSALAQVTGTGQRGQLGDRLRPFVVHLVDVGDNPIPDAVVQFRIVQRPALANGDTLSALNVLTDSLGTASTVLTLGSRPGRYVVQASAAGVRDTLFSAEAVFVVADVNNDNYQNIGDLTAIIDHILGRRILAGYDFLKADIDNNGVVDVRDAILCRDSLLTGVWNPIYNWANQMVVGKQAGMLAAAPRDERGKEEDTVNPIETWIQRTHIGSRFYLKNDMPVKGIQATLFMKQPVKIDSVDLIFPAAQMMRVETRSVGREVNIVIYNLANTPILTDTGAPIFRLPLKLSSLADIDSMRVIASVDTNVASVVPVAGQDLTGSLPVSWTLYQNYPNPFNSSTTVEFDVPEISGKMPRLAVQIFDLLGRKVITIEKGFYDAGARYRVVWDGRNDAGEHVATGVYFYRLLTGDYASTKKMLLLR